MPRPALAYLATPQHVGDGWFQQWAERLRTFAVAHGFALTKIYVDDTATRGAGYLSLTSDLDSRIADVVITPNVSHLKRAGASERAVRERGAVVIEAEMLPVMP